MGILTNSETAPIPDDYIATYDGFSKLWISSSALACVMTCGLKFKYKYIDKLSGAINIRMTAGSGAHKGRQHDLEQKIESHEDLSPDECTDAARDYVTNAFDGNEVHVEKEFEGKSKDAAKGITVDFAVDMASKDREVFLPEIQPAKVEEPMAVDYPGISRTIVGKTDVIDTDDVIRDLKTGKRSYGQAKADDNMGLTTYGLLYYALNQELPSGYAIENVVASGKSPVKTNVYESERGVDRLQRQLDRFAYWCRVIDSGIFGPADPCSWFCSESWCQFWAQCPCRSHQ